MAGLGNWLTAIRDHPDPLPDAQYRALVGLALRLDWRTGAGFASVAEVAMDARCHRTTAQHAMAWACERGLLERVKRGRHVGRGSSGKASDWRTRVPPQPVIRGRLPASQRRASATLRTLATSQPDPGNVAIEPWQRRAGATPSKSYTSKSSPSTRERAHDDPRAELASLGADERRSTSSSERSRATPRSKTLTPTSARSSPTATAPSSPTSPAARSPPRTLTPRSRGRPPGRRGAVSATSGPGNGRTARAGPTAAPTAIPSKPGASRERPAGPCRGQRAAGQVPGGPAAPPRPPPRPVRAGYVPVR